MLMELHNRQTREEYQLSPSAREILAIIEGAGQPLEPSVIAERLLITTGSMTSLLDTLQKRGLIRRLPHPGDRRKLLVDITPDAQAIVDEFLPSLPRTRTRADLRSAHHQRAAPAAPPPRQDPAGRHPGGPGPADTRCAPCPARPDSEHRNVTAARTGSSQAPGSHPQVARTSHHALVTTSMNAAVRCCHRIPAARPVTTLAQIRSVTTYPGPARTAQPLSSGMPDDRRTIRQTCRCATGATRQTTTPASCKCWMSWPSQNAPASLRTSGSSARTIHRK